MLPPLSSQALSPLRRIYAAKSRKNSAFIQSVARFWMDNWNGTPGIGGLHAIDTAMIALQKPNALASEVAEATPRLRQ